MTLLTWTAYWTKSPSNAQACIIFIHIYISEYYTVMPPPVSSRRPLSRHTHSDLSARYLNNRSMKSFQIFRDLSYGTYYPPASLCTKVNYSAAWNWSPKYKTLLSACKDRPLFFLSGVHLQNVIASIPNPVILPEGLTFVFVGKY